MPSTLYKLRITSFYLVSFFLYLLLTVPSSALPFAPHIPVAFWLIVESSSLVSVANNDHRWFTSEHKEDPDPFTSVIGITPHLSHTNVSHCHTYGTSVPTLNCSLLSCPYDPVLFEYLPYIFFNRVTSDYVRPLLLWGKVQWSRPMSDLVHRELNSFFLWLLSTNTWNGLLMTILTCSAHLIWRKIHDKCLFQREAIVVFGNAIALLAAVIGTVCRALGILRVIPPEPPDSPKLVHTIKTI